MDPRGRTDYEECTSMVLKIDFLKIGPPPQLAKNKGFRPNGLEHESERKTDHGECRKPGFTKSAFSKPKTPLTRPKSADPRRVESSSSERSELLCNHQHKKSTEHSVIISLMYDVSISISIITSLSSA